MSAIVTIYYDEEADIAYFKLSEKVIAYSKEIDENKWADFADDDSPVGLQLFQASEVMALTKRVHVQKQFEQVFAGMLEI